MRINISAALTYKCRVCTVQLRKGMSADMVQQPLLSTQPFRYLYSRMLGEASSCSKAHEHVL